MRRISWSVTLLLLLACSKDPESNVVNPGTGGSTNRGGSGGSRTGGSSGSGGSGSGGVGLASGGSGGSNADATGDSNAADGSGDATADGGGDSAVPTGATFILVSAGAGYGAPTPITTIQLNTTTGALTKGTSIAGLTNAFYGAISADKKFAYFVTEQEPATIATFSVAPATGSLSKVEEIKAPVGNGEYIGLHPNGKWLSIPYYSGGEVTVHPIGTDGKVGAASDTKPAGKGAGMSECHQAIFDKAGANLFVTCKKTGTETIAQFKFETGGKLTPNTPPTIPAPGGVRHLAFSKDEKFAYGITEGDTSVIAFTYDKATGKLAMLEKLPAFVDPLAKGGGSHILIHPSGKFLFSGSRFDNAIFTFAIDATTGKLTKASHTTDGLSFPRNFDIEPSGNYLIAGNQANDGAKIAANKKDGGDVTAFKIDQTTGALTKTGTPVKLDPSVWYVGTFTVP